MENEEALLVALPGHLHVRVESSITQTNIKLRGPQTSNVGQLILNKYVNYLQDSRALSFDVRIMRTNANSVSKLNFECKQPGNSFVRFIRSHGMIHHKHTTKEYKIVPPSSDPHNDRPL